MRVRAVLSAPPYVAVCAIVRGRGDPCISVSGVVAEACYPSLIGGGSMTYASFAATSPM